MDYSEREVSSDYINVGPRWDIRERGRNKYPMMEFNPYGEQIRNATMQQSVGNLIFRDLRHEQRRVAAMIPINRVEQPQHVRAHRASLLPVMMSHPCSHLDPEGVCRDPSHYYLHQNNIKTSDILHRLREGFSYVKDKNNELFVKDPSLSTIRGWTREKRTRFETPAEMRKSKKGHHVHGKGYKVSKKNGSETESGSESGIDESENDSEDKLHVKVPTEGDDRKGVRRLKGKNEQKTRREAMDKVRKYGDDALNHDNEYDDDDDDDEGVSSDRRRENRRKTRQNGDRDRDRHGRHGDRRSSDYDQQSQYDREVSNNWRDDTGTPRGAFLAYNHGDAPNPVGKDYVRKLENGKILSNQSQERLFEKRNDAFTNSENRNNFAKERTGSFHRQSLSRKNTFEAEGGMIRVTSFLSEPSFCNCKSPSAVLKRENSIDVHDCARCGKRVKTRTESSGIFERRSSSDFSRESSGEFVRKRSDSGDFRRHKDEKSSNDPSRSESPKNAKEIGKEAKESKTKKSRKKRKIPKAGEASDPDYMDNLRDRLEQGDYDIDLNDLPSIDDINQKLHFSEEEIEEDHYERKFVRPPLRYDQYRDAYLKALSVVRGRVLPTESWMLGINTTKSFVFSYFYGGYPKPRVLDESKQLPPPEQPKKAKKGAEMKSIFGSENVDDYLPGGPKNPFPGQYSVSPRRTGAKAKGKKGKKAKM